MRSQLIPASSSRAGDAAIHHAEGGCWRRSRAMEPKVAAAVRTPVAASHDAGPPGSQVGSQRTKPNRTGYSIVECT